VDPVVETQRSSWFFDALGEVAGFAKSLAKQFFKFLFAGFLFIILLTAIVGYSASEGLFWKGVLAGVLTFVGGMIVTFVISTKLSTVLAAGETVKAHAVGQKILEALFERLLGVTEKNPQGDIELSKSLHGMPVAEVETRLHAAGRALLQNRITSAAVPRIGLWLANQVQRLLVWVTIRVVVAHCTAGKSSGDNIDLLALRAILAREVDKWVIEKLRQSAFRLLLFAALGLVLAAWLIVKAMHLLPGS
jgi:hypothetical protein